MQAPTNGRRRLKQRFLEIAAELWANSAGQGVFVAAALATALAAAASIKAPSVGIGLDALAVVLVGIDLRRRITDNWTRQRLVEAIDSSRRSAAWEDLVGEEGAMKVTYPAEDLLGYPADSWLQPWFFRSIIHPNDENRARILIERGREAKVKHNVVLRAKSRSGDWHWLELRANPVQSKSGQHLLFAGVLIDRTSDVEIAQEADVLRRVVSESPLPHVIAERSADSLYDVTSMNLAAELLFDAPDEASSGTPLKALLARCQGMEELCDVLGTETEIPLRSVEIEVREDGVPRVFEALVQGIGDRCIALTFSDISERVRSLEELRVQALHDALTGMPNRRFLFERLTRELDEGATTGSSTSLITLDLNEFKEVNDALGHDVGDQLLVATAERLTASAPEGSVVARLGGDEFAVLLPGTTLYEAERHADHLAQATREVVVLNGLNLQISASMGLVSSPDHGTDAAELIRLADVAMYASKRSGRDVTIYDLSDNPFSKRRVRLLGELELGFDSGEFEVFYQPILDLKTGRTVGAEGLLRWRHPELGIVPPGEFVELAEVSGAIAKLTRSVIRQVLIDARVLERAGFNIHMSCNLSTRNLFEFDFVEAVSRIISELGLPKAGLRMEITESDLMDDIGRARQVLAELAELGATLAIDDFGTGHSSLERLRDLPVDCVKIDQGFVSSMLDAPRSQTLLRDIISMMENLGFATVAEGVEDEASADLLREFGCRQGQGFLWARPIPLPDFIGYLTAERSNAATEPELFRSTYN